MELKSPAFQEGAKIPKKYTCEGWDFSPPLIWNEVPDKTQSLALIMDDPDAPGGIFTHWVLFNLPPNSRELLEGVSPVPQLPSGALQGKNDFGKFSYGGPCPPPGSPHRYRFTLYALDQQLELEAGVSKKQLLKAIEGHILAQGQLIGTYQR